VPIALVTAHFVIAALAPLGARLLGRRIFVVCALAPLATVVWAATVMRGVLDGHAVTGGIDWLPAIGLVVSFRVDAFALLMVALVSGIGTLIFLYSAPYFADPGSAKHAPDRLRRTRNFAHSHDSRADLGRFASHLTAFAGAMLGLVLVDNLLTLYVFWELTSITSYLLIGYDDRKGSARAAALQAIVVTGAGGLAMLAGFIVLGQAAGTYEISELLADPPTSGLAAVGVLLTLAGAFTKSAQVPFHTWLANAMAAPTPVSAYLHSATMVKAGVYLIARFAPAFAVVMGWRPLVLGIGLLTMLVGGLRALRQDDLKLLLAYGTVSQLGFMLTLFGAGLGATTDAAAVLLLAHALFKAALFMVAGIVEHQTGTRDIRKLSGVGRRMPALALIGTIAAMSMAGLPPLFGFIAKEVGYESYLHADLAAPWSALMLAGLVVGSMLTFAYSYRFVWGAFAVKPLARQRGQVGAAVEAPGVALLAAPAVLMSLTVAAGVVPSAVDHLLDAAAQALVPNEAAHLALWHGLNVGLGLSLLTVTLGMGLAWAREPVAALQERYGGWPGAQDAYERSIQNLNGIADRLTGVVQNGSLPIYLAVILLTAVGLSGSGLLRLPGVPQPTALTEDALQTLVAVAIIIAAVSLIFSSRRFASVLLLGAVGYGVAVLFVLQGAPDLALTQFLIESLSVVVFVLVLRYLPPTYSRSEWRPARVGRIVVSLSVGVFVLMFALSAGGSRPDSFVPVSREFLARSLEQAGGHNVVNVILVDFRGYDTLGEITVLLVAALGVSALVLASRHDDGVGDERGMRSRGVPGDGGPPSDEVGDGPRSTQQARMDMER
jgi:multicomponent Na+:H+ antiporter subunit A